MKFLGMMMSVLLLCACQAEQKTASTNSSTQNGKTVWAAPQAGSLLGGGYSHSGDGAPSPSPEPQAASNATKPLPH